MTVVVCVDDRGGMTFNKRRVSRDRTVYADIAADLGGKALCLSEYSLPLFSELDASVRVNEEPLLAGDGESVCFVENKAILPYLGKINKIVIYRWNRHYPSDMTLDIEPLSAGFKLLETLDLAGYSHEKITKEVYVR